jgi:tRNA dimethylallyltransferase
VTQRPPRQAGRHLVLTGPTASGKSAVALELARRRIAAGAPVEIVTVDSMQVYRGMDIGTAKPTVEEQAEVPHHLLDLVDPDAEFSVAEFTRAAEAAIDDIEARGARAVLVGGTALYLQAVVDRLRVPGRYPQVAADLEREPDTATLHERLEALDPLAASRMEPTNRRRVLRALEVTLGSGQPFSTWGPGLGHHPDTPYVLCGLRMPRDQLAERIELRYRQQMDCGFPDEVRRLRDRVELSRTARQALGYAELLEHLEGRCTLEEALERAVTRTRQFAVRQIRWFRRDPRIVWFDHDDHADQHGPGGQVARTAAALDELWRERAAGAEASTATVGDGHDPASAGRW